MDLKPHKHVFRTLDAMRGLAAILVVIFHNEPLFGWKPVRGQLAVDLFFGLSGFVLAHAYQEKLDEGLPTATFLKLRLFRLAPLYLLALLLSVLTATFTGARAELHLSTHQYILCVLLSLFLIPSYFARSGLSSPFPLNPPCWTLFLELLMNVLHALFLRRLSLRALCTWVGVSGLALLGCYGHFRDLDLGWKWDTFLTAGVVRMVFSYTLGMLLYRLWQKHHAKVRLPAWAVLAGVLAAFMLPIRHEVLAALLSIFVVLPFFLYCGALTDVSGAFGRALDALGAASYAIYILHPVFFSVARRLWRVPHLPDPLAGGVMLILLVGTSFLVDRVYDRPVRSTLRPARASRPVQIRAAA